MIKIYKKQKVEDIYIWQDITDLVYYEGLTISDTINSSMTCSFEIKKNRLQLEIGECIKVSYFDEEQNETVLFEGIITYLGASLVSSKLISQQVKAQDYTLLADRKIVNGVYINKTVRQLLNLLLYGDADLSIGQVVKSKTGEIIEGILIEKANFNFIPLSEALNSISDLAGYYWRVDFNKKIHIWEDMAIISSIELKQKLLRDVEIEFTTESYRNVQITVGPEVEIKNYRVEVLRGDGTAKTFTLSRGIANLKGITYDSSVWVARNQSTPPTPPSPDEPPQYPWQEQKAVQEGTKEIEGASWLYRIRENTIKQVDKEPTLGENDYVAVIYTFYEPRRVLLELPSEIEALSKKEGTSGRWQKVEMAQELEKEEDLRKLTQTLLTKYGRIPKTITVELDSVHYPEILKKPIISGEMIKVDLPSFDIFQYARVNGSSLRFTGDLAELKLTLLGSDVEQWWQYFAKQKKRTQKMVIGAGETVLDFLQKKCVLRAMMNVEFSQAVGPSIGIGTAEIGRHGIA